jgi:hypothetical protein
MQSHTAAIVAWDAEGLVRFLFFAPRAGELPPVFWVSFGDLRCKVYLQWDDWPMWCSCDFGTVQSEVFQGDGWTLALISIGA